MEVALRYEKGRKGASRQRIMEVAGERFRSDGIAASGLAAIMGDAGLTNGAFYPHFKSKAELVRESVSAALVDQAGRMQALTTQGGLDAAIAAYLSPEHRDASGSGCTLAALLPELAREPAEARASWAEGFAALVRQLESALPPKTEDREAVALGIYATLIGTLQLSRALKGTELSDGILAAGGRAARELAGAGAREPG